MSSPDLPDRTPAGDEIPDPDVTGEDNLDLPDSEIPDADADLDLPDSGEIPQDPTEGEPDVLLEPDIENARDMAGDAGYDPLVTDELRPETDVTEFQPPDRLSRETQRRPTEDDERGDTLDQRLAQEIPDPTMEIDDDDR
ncbi:hypothetical protein [Actinopolymorpha singaporensis]|uniref:DUF5709 domain-containing protein n=1 Tax=Actinopolymorpha singaporensis TaxID=117157 RepID=A0A1H1TCS6_9ACTN|nr:hypothetical protein [Actinopolymorpha singaporensis]SDS58023.1 hypothetical protein SAMN04489717_3149 [Actinopolymorpha singaporensis]